MNKSTNAFSHNRFTSSTQRARNLLIDNEVKYQAAKSATVGNTKFLLSDVHRS
jgi:hypothetical protein